MQGGVKTVFKLLDSECQITRLQGLKLLYNNSLLTVQGGVKTEFKLLDSECQITRLQDLKLLYNNIHS